MKWLWFPDGDDLFLLIGLVGSFTVICISIPVSVHLLLSLLIEESRETAHVREAT